MHIALDDEACVGSGACVLIAPDVFDQRDEDGIALLRNETPGDDRRAAVDEAAARCPALAIRIES